MKRSLLILLNLLIITYTVMATHNRAGEITYRQLSGLTFEVTITTYTYIPGQADRYSLYILWGDNTQTELPRINGYNPDTKLYQGVDIGDDYRLNIYKGTHTYPGPGVYKLSVEDPNRNEGVKNIPNSVNVVFALESALVINANIGVNNTPILTNRPIGKAYIDQVFIHNPAAYDSDGDSISYKLTVCRGEDGEPIEGYEYPADSTQLYIDPYSGDLTWDSPKEIGKYNVAISIDEWRKGRQIGRVIRDMQIDVLKAENTPPVNGTLKDFCVVADSIIQYDIEGTDADGNTLTQRASGGPLVLTTSPATFTEVESSDGYIRSTFEWQTTCEHVRDAEYLVVVQTEDNIVSSGTVIKAYDSDNFNIKIMGPPPRNLQTFSYTDSIKLTWLPSNCSNIEYYEIYRKEGDFFYFENKCSNGIPTMLGFELVGQTENGSIYNFSDVRSPDNIQQGIEYCYLVIGVFENGTQTKVSNKACTSLIQGDPAIIQVSVEVSDETTGEINLVWLTPSQETLDTINLGSPFYYRILRRNPSTDDFVVVDSITGDLSDTTYTDINLNTFQYPYYYKIEFVYTDLFDNTQKSFTGGIASTSYPELTPSDNQITIKLLKDAPWRNTNDTISYHTGTSVFEELVILNENEQYTHENLINGETYFYQVKSRGIYTRGSTEHITYNKSHVLSSIPIDNVPPCSPILEVISNCDSAQNHLNWNFDSIGCYDDIYEYIIYYSQLENAPLDTLFILSAGETMYTHPPGNTLAACYSVVAVDSAGNKSPSSNLVCVDECDILDYFKLPNVFTPNGDGVNEIYTSIRLNDYIKKVDMQIFNRWGRLMFSTTDPDINWDGRYSENDKIVPSGVYYYVCDVYVPRITGEQMQTLTGFIHVFSSDNANKNNLSE